MAAIYIQGVFGRIALAVGVAAVASASLLIISGYAVGLYTGGGMQAVSKLALSWTDSSVAEHLTNATGAVKMFTENPLFGGGLGVYIDQWKGSNALVIHSTPLWILGEFGLVGLLVFLAPIARIAGVELPRFRSNDMAGNMTVLIVVGFGVMSLFHELLYQRTFWFLLGAALIPLTSLSRTPACEARIHPAPV